MVGENHGDGLSRQTEDFLRFYGQCQRQLFVYIISLLPNATDAQDILQETSLVLWEKFGEFDRDASFFSWARGIAYRKVIQHWEKKGRQSSLLRRATVEMLAKNWNKSAVDGTQDRQAALAHCLKRLSTNDAMLIKERYAPGMTVQALAESMGRTPNALSQSLRRIRHLLLDCMTSYLSAEERGV